MPPQSNRRTSSSNNNKPWSGLKGKPESANMGFLLQQVAHRFPGPGYNTWHSRVLKEEQGHLRLIRDKINDYFAFHDEADTDPTLQGPMTTEGFGSINPNNNTNNKYKIPQPPPAPAPSPAPPPPPLSTSSVNGNAFVSNKNSGSDKSSKVNFVKSGGDQQRQVIANDPQRTPISAERDRLATKKPAEIDEDKFYTSLSEANQRRLFNIWPQVGRGWNDRNVQQTLYEKGRDVDESPLRTFHPNSSLSRSRPQSSARNSSCGMFEAPPIRPSSCSSAARGIVDAQPSSSSSSAPYEKINGNNNSSDYIFAPTTSREIGFGAPRGRQISQHRMFQSNSYKRSHADVARGAACLLGENEGESTLIGRDPDWRYNRRVMAPAIPEPVLSRRAESLSRAYAAGYKTATSQDEEATHHLIKKINDLEQEVASQQRDRAVMQEHIQQLKGILYQQVGNSGVVATEDLPNPQEPHQLKKNLQQQQKNQVSIAVGDSEVGKPPKNQQSKVVAESAVPESVIRRNSNTSSGNGGKAKVRFFTS